MVLDKHLVFDKQTALLDPYSLPADNGLFYGKSGQAIICFLVGSYTGKTQYNEFALEILNIVGDQIADIEDLGFARGIAGVGWSVEWLVQHDFLDVDTDDILEDVDNTLYKSVVYTLEQDISLANGILGKMAYFSQRFQNYNATTNRYRSLSHHECLVILIDRLQELLHQRILKLGARPQLTDNELIDFGHSLYYLSTMLELNVNRVCLEDALYSLVEFVDSFLTNFSNREPFTVLHIYLLLCYKMAADIHGHSYWKSRAKKLYCKHIKSGEIRQNDAHVIYQPTVEFLISNLFPEIESRIFGENKARFLQNCNFASNALFKEILTDSRDSSLVELSLFL